MTEWQNLSLFDQIRNLKTQLYTAIGIALLHQNIGYANAYTAQSQASMMDEYTMGEIEFSWVGSLTPLAAGVGTLISGPFITLIGRKTVLVIGGFGFFFSWLLVSLSVNVQMVFAGRFCIGLSMGVSSAATPIYLGEALQPEIRGALMLMPTLIGNSGIMMADVTGKWLEWRNHAILANCLPLIFICFFAFYLRESPRWLLIEKKDEQKFREALIWLRGPQYDIEKEMKEIIESQREFEAMNVRLVDIFKKNNAIPILIIMTMMFFQQFSGINAVIYYSTEIFQKSHNAIIDKKWCTTFIGISDFLSTFFAALIVDKYGRKILIYVSGTILITTQLTIGTFFFVCTTTAQKEKFSMIVLICLVVFVFGFSFGFGPVPWLLMGEIIPTKIRGYGAAISSATNFFGAFIVTKSFGPLGIEIGTGPVFYLTAICTFGGIMFTKFVVPQTRGKTLETIEKQGTAGALTS